jgi:HK97 family phage major capsid protein
LVAQLKAKGRHPMPAAQRAAAPVTRMSPRDALSHGLATSSCDEVRERTAEQTLAAVTAWVAEAIGQSAIAVKLWNAGADLLPMHKAAGESLDTAGGAIVPSQVANFILAYRDRAVFRQNASSYQMVSDVLSVPRRTGGLQTSFINEGAALVESTPTFDSVGFSAKKLAVFGKFSSEPAEDSASDVVAYFLQDAGNALGLREDDCGFNGDGTSTYAGMTGVCPLLLDSNHSAGRVAAASGHKTFQLLDVVDLQALMGALPDRFWGNSPKLYLSRYGASNWLGRLGGANGSFQFAADGTVRYAGIQVVTTPKLPGTGDNSTKVMALFGDLASASALGSSRDITLKTSDQKYLESDELAYRVTERFDIVSTNLGDNSAAGALVALVGTA